MKITVDATYERQFELTNKMDKVKNYQFVLGYRTWLVGGDKLYPMSQQKITPWPNEAPYAAICPGGYCKRTASAIHTCGFYAYNQLKNATREAPLGLYGMGSSLRLKRGPYLDSHIQTHFVVGAVLGWGQIQFYQEGFRAEFARPLALIDPAFKYDIPEVSVNGHSQSKNFIKKLFYKNISFSEPLGPPVPTFPKNFSEVAEAYNVPRMTMEDFEKYFERLSRENKIVSPSVEDVMQLPAQIDKLSLMRRTLSRNADFITATGVLIGGAFGAYKFVKTGAAGRVRDHFIDG